jgi:hypothetical protein
MTRNPTNRKDTTMSRKYPGPDRDTEEPEQPKPGINPNAGLPQTRSIEKMLTKESNKRKNDSGTRK